MDVARLAINPQPPMPSEVISSDAAIPRHQLDRTRRSAISIPVLLETTTLALACPPCVQVANKCSATGGTNQPPYPRPLRQHRPLSYAALNSTAAQSLVVDATPGAAVIRQSALSFPFLSLLTTVLETVLVKLVEIRNTLGI